MIYEAPDPLDDAQATTAAAPATGITRTDLSFYKTREFNKINGTVDGYYKDDTYFTVCQFVQPN